MPRRMMPVSGEQLEDVLERHGVSAYQFSKLAGVSHSMVTRLLKDERAAGHHTRDKLAKALYKLGEPHQVVERIFPVIPRGRKVYVRDMPAKLFTLIKDACRKTRGLNRDVVIKPFVEAAPYTPNEVARAVATYAERRGLSFEGLVLDLVPDAPRLEALPEDDTPVHVSISGIPEEWYRAWRVGLARLNKPAGLALQEAFELSAPFPPGAVVEAAKRLAKSQRAGFATWVARTLG